MIRRGQAARKEYLATLDDTAWSAASDFVPKFVSPSDPAGAVDRPLTRDRHSSLTPTTISDVKFGIILDVEASRAIRQAEVGAARAICQKTDVSDSLRYVHQGPKCDIR